jgi:hypothetical protein
MSELAQIQKAIEDSQAKMQGLFDEQKPDRTERHNLQKRRMI